MTRTLSQPAGLNPVRRALRAQDGGARDGGLLPGAVRPGGGADAAAGHGLCPAGKMPCALNSNPKSVSMGASCLRQLAMGYAIRARCLVACKF